MNRTLDLFKNCNGKKVSANSRWINEPAEWSFENEILTVKPDADTDFIRKINGHVKNDAPFLFTKHKGDFTLKAKVSLTPAGMYDAAALLVRISKEYWAKLCVEQNSYSRSSIVSVVTRQWSDDANGEKLQKPSCWLRITRKQQLFGLHYSLNGSFWWFVRSFGWNEPGELMVGVAAQSPKGEGAIVRFEDVHLSNTAVKDFRSGE